MKFSECMDFLFQNQKRIMIDVDKKHPPLTLNAIVVSQMKSSIGNKATIGITNTSSKLSIKTLIEQILYTTDKNPIKCTIIDSYDDKIIVKTHNKIPNKKCILKLTGNFINEILLKSLSIFVKQETKSQNNKPEPRIHHTLYENFNITNNKIENSIVEINQPECMRQLQNIKFYNSNLNLSQQAAVFYGLKGNPYRIMGPPGTGKTTVILELLLQFLNIGKKVLVCGPSNTSIDNIILRLESYLKNNNRLNEITYYRQGSNQKGLFHLNLYNMAEESVKFMAKEEKEIMQRCSVKKSQKENKEKMKKLELFKIDKAERIKSFLNDMKQKANVVFSTLFSSIKEGKGNFDICIVDETCQGSILECFLAVIKAKNYILVGDPKQLCSEYTSLYQCLDIPTVMLNEQYRMHKNLIEFSNKTFYGDNIISPKSADFLFFNEKNILFIDTAFFFIHENKSGTSTNNIGEASLAVDAARWIRSNPGNSESSIGIISPYSAQVELIRDSIDGLNHVDSNTVDSYQGQERDFIILSFVRSNPGEEIGFLGDENRINVALTRCKKGLVLISDSNNFRRNSFFKQLLSFLNSNAYTIDPVTFKYTINSGMAMRVETN